PGRSRSVARAAARHSRRSSTDGPRAPARTRRPTASAACSGPWSARCRSSCTPEGLWARIVAHFGGQDIDFPESPEFSSAYRLRGSDEAAVRALFTAARRQVFELFRGQHAGGAGQELMWWRDGALPPPDQFDTFLMEGDRIQRVFARD